MSKASSILSFCGKIKRKWKSSSCKTFDKFNLWLWLILWPSSPWERCRKPVQELAQDQFIRNLPRWRPLRVDFSLFSHRFPTWKMHSTPGCTWKMQLMQKTPQNRSFEGIITSQSSRPAQIFVTLDFVSKSLHISTHKEFSTSFSLCQGVFISITTFSNPVEMIMLKIYNVHAPQRVSI